MNMITCMSTRRKPLPAITDEFRSMLRDHGVAVTARILQRRYVAVREAAETAGLDIRPGRRPDATIATRNEVIRQRYRDGESLLSLAQSYGVTTRRITQILQVTTA